MQSAPHHPRPTPGIHASSRLPPTRRNRGASSVEYLMVLALVVLPLALLSPMIIGMLSFYLSRITTMIRMPLG